MLTESKFASLRLSTPSWMPPVSYGMRSGDFSGISRVLLDCAIGWRQFAEAHQGKTDCETFSLINEANVQDFYLDNGNELNRNQTRI